MRLSSQMVRPSKQLLAACLLLSHVAATAPVTEQGAYNVNAAKAEPSTSTTTPNRFAAIPYHVAGAGGALLEQIGRFFDHFLPDPDSMGAEDGGLFGGGDGSTLAWGGSTLEVIKTQASYLTRPAAFGPRIVSDDGLRGTLLPISDFYVRPHEAGSTTFEVDNHGCPFRGGPGWREEGEEEEEEEQQHHAQTRDSSQQTSQSHDRRSSSNISPPSDWIALVERGGGCSFISKIRVAQALNATAVVVGDAPARDHQGREDNDPGYSGGLVTMFARGDTSDISIPSTFITRPSYVDLFRLILETAHDDHQDCLARKKQGKDCKEAKPGVQVILWRDDVMWEWPLIDLAFVLLLLPSFMTLITIIVHRFRLARQRRRERAPEVAVSSLPCLIWRGNGQPWEKVEDAVLGGLPGSSPKGKEPKSSRFGFLSFFGGTRQTPDMELGAQGSVDTERSVTDADAPASGSNEAGPSSTPVVLKTTPVPPPPAPAASATDRTYYGCDECAICLSEFVDGDHIRVLPCGHVFHLPEIDSWLLRVKRLCPVCKRDVTVPPAPAIPTPTLANGAALPTVASTSSGAGDEAGNVRTSVEADEADDENTPLLSVTSRAV